MRKKLIFIALFITTSSISAQSDSLNSDSIALSIQEYLVQLDSIEQTLEYEHGKIQLQNGLAEINVPAGYKFLNSKQSTYVLTDLWGNPPSETLGLLFPENTSPLSDNFTYAVEISYSEDGYIEDDDAEDIDYDELLEGMQEEIENENPARIKQGYSPYQLVGWASEPFYDKAAKKLHWAQEIKFEDQETSTLNYNIRVLGRKGYLTLNAIGDMEVLPEFKKDIDPILSSVEFNEGSKYNDFDPEIDKVAAYGIGGLIAGKLLAKVGFFALILKFWKIIAVAVVGGFSLFRKKLFGSKES